MAAYIFDGYTRNELRHAFKRADAEVFEDGLRFLEEDPKTFGSGYLKEIIWKYIKRYELNAGNIERLENAALNYLKRPMSREFKFMCHTMSQIATKSFWEQVEQVLDPDNPTMPFSAYCLSAYSRGIQAGENRRLELKHYYYRYLYRPNGEYYSVDALLALVYESENWQKGIVAQKPDPDDLPIIYFMPKRDSEFMILDMHYCVPDVVIPKLAQVLSTGELNVWTEKSWLYAIYLLGQIDDVRVVSVLTEFLRNKIDYKFDGPKKSFLENRVLKVLRHYATPEALTIIEQHSR